jgi:glycosyltransferase involved in cell wall biosynthesis
MNQTKKILIIGANGASSELLPELITELLPAGFDFSLLGEKFFQLNRFFADKKLPRKRAWFGPKNIILSSLLRPWFCLIWLVRFGYRRYQKNLDTVICIGIRVQSAIQLPARLLKIKTICLILPEDALLQAKQAKKRLLRAVRGTVLVVFLERSREQLLQSGCSAEQIKLVRPGIRLHQHKFQENIFHKIAQAETQTKKFFNIGLLNGLETEEQVTELELIFQAIRQARLIIPNIQLIVLGEGRQKKKLLWLAKKMEMESLVWLVGEQLHLRKWLDSFDAFLAIKTKPTLDDFLLVLKTMEAELPVIAPADVGFEELIDDGINGLLTGAPSSEALATQIIRLKQDKRLMLRLSQAARERVEKQFNLEGVVEIFKKLL